MPTRHASGFAIMLAITTMATGACGTRDKRVRGGDLLKQTSARIASARALSVTTDETNDRIARDGKTRQVHIQRVVSVRRPDRMWFRTSGDRNTEGFYDGSRLTLLFHGEKVFGVIPTRSTLDDTIQTVSERYDIPLPIGDLLTSDPQKSYLSSQTTGGWEGEDTIDGKRSARAVAYQVVAPPAGAIIATLPAGCAPACRRSHLSALRQFLLRACGDGLSRRGVLSAVSQQLLPIACGCRQRCCSWSRSRRSFLRRSRI